MLRDLAAFVFVVMPVQAQEPKPATAAAEPTVVLEGRVVDLRGEGVPLAKVWVVATEEPERDLAKNVCDGEGFFRIGQVPAQANAILRATSDGLSIGEARGSATQPAVLRLHDAATLRGVLRNRAGKPVAGSIVRSFSRTVVLATLGNTATTDENGAFTLTKIPLGPTRICAVAPGEGLFALETLVTGDGEVTLQPVLGSRTSIAISVAGLPAGPVAGLRVAVIPQRGYARLPPPWDRPQLAADGSCVLADLPDGDYDVRVVSAAYAFEPRHCTVKETRGPHDLKVTAIDRDRAALEVHAVLRDAAGEPVPGVALAITAQGKLVDGVRGLVGGDLLTQASSAGDGTLTFRLQEAAGTSVVVRSLDDRWTLDQVKTAPMVGAYDRGLLDEHECTLAPGTPLELRALPAVSVKGRVVLADGRPVAFATVELEQHTDNAWLEWTPFEQVPADREGNYRFRSLHHVPGQVRIRARSLVATGASGEFSLAEAGAKVTVPGFAMTASATIEGVVSGPDHKPAAGMVLSVCEWNLERGQQESHKLVEVVTDRHGRFRFLGVAPGGAQVLVGRAADGSATWIDVGLRVPETVFEVEAGKTCTHDLQLSRQ